MAVIAAGAEDPRAYFIGAVGIRADGRIVTSRNGASRQQCPEAHAEARLCRKLTKGSIVWVARVTRSGVVGLAKPCSRCQAILRSTGVTRVYYTISDTESGIMEL
jgi:tRNA(Arg) A34 adenosine deaminase TadA